MGSSSGVRASIHNGFWVWKLLVLSLLCVTTFVIPVSGALEFILLNSSSFRISRHLKSTIYTAGAPPGHLPHRVAVLRPGRGLRVPPGTDGPCYPGNHMIWLWCYNEILFISPGCPGGVTAPPPGPAPQLPPAVPDPGPGAGPHHNLGGSLRLALHQVSEAAGDARLLKIWYGIASFGNDW